MKYKRIALTWAVVLLGLAASLLLLTTLAAAPIPEEGSPVEMQAISSGDTVGKFSDAQAISITFPSGPWPWYAQEEISVNPEPPLPGQPAEICAEVLNQDPLEPHIATLEFSIAPLGIGLRFDSIGSTMFEVPAGGPAHGCVNWVPPTAGPWSIEVKLTQDVTPEVQRSQRNLDMHELLRPGQPHTLTFPVSNPTDQPATINMEIVPQLPGWQVELLPEQILDLTPGETMSANLRVTPPADLPEDGQPIVDVQGFVNGEMIGGFRKLFRPPVPLHRFRDPFFAESEISVWPYPTRAGEPTEICVDLHNWTEEVQPVEALFSWADFGIGLPFQDINGPIAADVPPQGRESICIVWIPPAAGQFDIQVELIHVGDFDYPPQISQRNLDVSEPLRPGVAHQLSFPVGNFPNPFTNPEPQPMAVWLEAEVLLPGWEVQLSPEATSEILPGEMQWFTLTVTPPTEPLPQDNTPIVDVRAMTTRLDQPHVLGGFRKLYRPPVPLHPFPDPSYAEREISIHPYPPLAGEPTEICVELRNPTSEPQDVAVQFAWAEFGIGIPFTPINGARPVHLPPHSLVRECLHWIPPVSGQICLEVTLEIINDEPDMYPLQRSQRNMDVIEPLKPGVPDQFEFLVRNPLDEPADIEFGHIPHQPGWGFTIEPAMITGLDPGEIQTVTLTVYPPDHLPPDGSPIVDVEAFARGELIGGFRKIFRPPIPLHPFPDPPYAEREIRIFPYPPLAGEPTEVCVELRNPTAEPQDVLVQFAWANFGIGIPFSPIGGPRPVHLPPHSLVNECIHWVPPVSGQVCLEVTLEIVGDPTQVYDLQRSQRNMDVIEPLKPGVMDSLEFTVGNPTNTPVTITMGIVSHLPGWEISLEPESIRNLPADETTQVTLTVIPPDDLPPDGQPILDVEAFIGPELIGGFRKLYRPPIPLHPFPDPPYAEREISIHPYPPQAGEPTEVCVDLRNPTPFPQDVEVQFAWANFGIGLPFTPINGARQVHLPPYSQVRECIHWVPPLGGQLCLEVVLNIAGDDPSRYEPQRSRLNIDINEPLQPAVAHSMFFPVGNPFQEPLTITMGLVPHLPDWEIRVEPEVLQDVQPDEIRVVTLTVTPTLDMPEDGQTVVDVEAFANGHLVGGFRKIYRPPVPIHRPRDPVYAESEIFIHPYPPRAQEPTEIGVEIRNPTLNPQNLLVKFSYAEFGIGLPFTPIHDPIEVIVPPEGMIRPTMMWIAPHEGLWCIEVELIYPGDEEGFFSRRNIDVGEPLEPLIPHSRTFPVGNPFDHPVTITLGLVPHFPDWELDLSEDVLSDVKPAEFREVTLTVTAPVDLPLDGAPIVDVEAYVDGQLIGGFRKIFRPPVPIHRPRDPVYAESEIGVDPYPLIPGQSTELSVEVFNPTDKDRLVTATFSIAPFGIGLPFSTTDITPNPIVLFVPAHGAARGHVIWQPPFWEGKFCVKVTLQMAGHDPIWSQRNIDVGEPLEPGQPHSLRFPVGNPTNQPMTVTLGLVNHRDGWQVNLSEDTLTNLGPGQTRPVTLTVEPPEGAELGFGEPIVDVEAFINGELIGGFRKLDRPPIPLHKPHEKGYAETEIRIVPYPPKLGQVNQVSTVVQNTSDQAMTVALEFGWAKFGMGIPFTNTGMTPYTQSVTLGPAMTRTVEVNWQPQLAGPQCVMILMSDPDGIYGPQESQRNVDVVERPPCGETKVFSFTLYNDSPFTNTVDLGVLTFDVPATWEVTTVPSSTMELGPNSSGIVLVQVMIPCPPTFADHLIVNNVQRIQQVAGSVPIIDVEGYIEGDLVGGIELQFEPPAEPEKNNIYLPAILN